MLKQVQLENDLYGRQIIDPKLKLKIKTKISLYSHLVKLQQMSEPNNHQPTQFKSKLIPAAQIYQSYRKSKGIVRHTPLIKSQFLSKKYNAKIFLKREDLQDIRSFKIRGAATAFRSLTEEQKQRGVVTASAGNHAQGIAYCCHTFNIRGTIFMPSITPKLKIKSVQRFGGEWLDIILTGTTFDDAVTEAKKFQGQHNAVFIHAFDNRKVIEGQGGLAAQILQDWTDHQNLDYVFTCVGGGGLASGLVSYLSQMAPDTKLFGFQPLGSPSMYNSLKTGKRVILDELQTFVDGASMKNTGEIPFQILSQAKVQITLVDEGLVAKTMLDMYEAQAIILQPAGALAVSGLELMKEMIAGKNVVCVLSGSNNDITRLSQIKLRALIYEKKEAYYMVSSMIQINIKILIQSVISPSESDIIFINSAKKYNSSAGQCLLGVSFTQPDQQTNKHNFERRLIQHNYRFKQLSAKDPLLKILL